MTENRVIVLENLNEIVQDNPFQKKAWPILHQFLILLNKVYTKGDTPPMKAAFITLLLLLNLASTALADDYKFTLINKTGFEIIDLYFSPEAKNQWGEEVLTVDTIQNNDKMDLHLSRKERSKTWDILVINDELGINYKWPGLQLSEMSTLILTIKAGQPMAFSE